MDCIDEGVIQMYIDGEISIHEKNMLDEHIQSCKTCQQKLEEQRAISSSVVEAINLLAEQPIKIQQEFSKIRRLPLKKILYAVSAASLLLFGIAFLNNYNKTEDTQPQIYYEVDWSVDANKPITDQEFVISVFDADGNEADLLMN